MAAHPPSKPHVEGDGFSQPHVLHWESPGTRGINGYSVQVKVDGPLSSREVVFHVVFYS